MDKAVALFALEIGVMELFPQQQISFWPMSFCREVVNAPLTI
jgi:hypothetical protein